MSKSDELWQYAEEAMGWALNCTSPKEKLVLINLACMWMQAAERSEIPVVVKEIRMQGRVRPPQLAASQRAGCLPAPQPPTTGALYHRQLNWGPCGIVRAAMASNSSPEELREHARIFRRWADETGSPEMREAFLSMANSITHRLLCWEEPRIGVVLRNFELFEHRRAGRAPPRGVEHR